MSRGPYQAASPNYSCTYAMTGAEIASGEEVSQTVLVALTDAAGNRGQAVSGLVFDFKAPVLVSAAPSPSSAKHGDVLAYTVNVSEKLAAPGRPALVVKKGGVAQPGFFGAPVTNSLEAAKAQHG